MISVVVSDQEMCVVYRLFWRIRFPCENPRNLNAQWYACVDTCEVLVVGIQNQVGTSRCPREVNSQVPAIALGIIRLSPGATSFDLAARRACCEGVPHTDVTIAEVSVLSPLAYGPIDVSLDVPVTEVLEERIVSAVRMK